MHGPISGTISVSCAGQPVLENATIYAPQTRIPVTMLHHIPKLLKGHFCWSPGRTYTVEQTQFVLDNLTYSASASPGKGCCENRCSAAPVRSSAG